MIEETNKISKSSDIRQYSGTGEITFEKGEKVSCDFNIDCEYNGKSKLIATIFLNKDNYFILNTLYNGFLVTGRFRGMNRNNSHIGISKIVLDTFKHFRTELTIPILQYFKLNYSTSKRHEQIKLFFFIQTSINVIYDKIVKDQYVLLSYGLVNFNLGFNSNELILPNIIFELDINNFEFKFVKKFDYNDIYPESKRYSIQNVICYVLVYTKQQNERKVTNILNNICLLLSIVNANWIVPLFCDSISERKIRKSLLYKIKTYDFISSYYSIDNKNFKAIKKFIENAYPRFLQNEILLSLKKVF